MNSKNQLPKNIYHASLEEEGGIYFLNETSACVPTAANKERKQI
jgi:hypothetical protein